MLKIMLYKLFNIRETNMMSADRKGDFKYRKDKRFSDDRVQHTIDHLKVGLYKIGIGYKSGCTHTQCKSLVANCQKRRYKIQ